MELRGTANHKPAEVKMITLLHKYIEGRKQGKEKEREGEERRIQGKEKSKERLVTIIRMDMRSQSTYLYYF